MQQVVAHRCSMTRGRGDDGLVRIVSLLPSATEIVYALGLGDSLVGVTHECDWPQDARTKRQVSRSTIPADATAAEIDDLVAGSMSGGPPTYLLDESAFRDLDPHLVLTQDLCAVCAVPAGQVEQALDTLGCAADVVSLDPSSLEEVLADVLRVGAVTGRAAQAESVVTDLRRRLATVEAAVAGRPRPRTFALEWGDPPYNGGHWVPEMIARAGGDPVLGAWGTPSVRVRWEDIAAAEPDLVVFMPCGYDLDGAVTQAAPILARPEIAAATVVAVDASGCFSRPGPRLVDGVEILAAALHPQVRTAPAAGMRVLRSATG
jgi:iron complex transport system substrate-binding protein